MNNGKFARKFMKIRGFIHGAVFVLLVLCACQDNNGGEARQPAREKNGHVWKEQTDALDKARAVEDMVQESATAQERRIQEETQ
jgi:hypothetical protein